MRHFLECLEPLSLTAFAKGFCVHTGLFLLFQQEVYSSALAFNSWLHQTSKSTRNKRLEPSQFFLEYVYNPAHECDLDSHDYVGAFKNHYGPLIPQLFLLSICPDSCFLPTVFIALVSFDGKHLPLIVFDK